MQVKKVTVRTKNEENRLVPNCERSMSRMYIVTLLIQLICRLYHVKFWLDEAHAGIKISRRNISNLRYADDTTPYGRKRRTKEPLGESERGE